MADEEQGQEKDDSVDPDDGSKNAANEESGEKKPEVSRRPNDQDDSDADLGQPLEEGPEVSLTAQEFSRLQVQAREIRAAALGSGDAVDGPKIGSVAGDVNFYASAPGRAWLVRAYSAGEQQDLLDRFAGTPSREQLVTLLKSTRVALLVGPPQTGRKTTALAALALCCQGINRISSGLVPAELTTSDVKPGHGYVYDATQLSWAHNITETDLLGCIELLEEHDVRLVVIGLADSATHAVRTRVVQHKQADAMDVLKRHLRAELPDTDIAAITQKVIYPPSRPYEAAGLAFSLAEGIRAGGTPEETLANQPDLLRERARSLLRQRYDAGNEEKDLGRRAFLIAWSVLHDLPPAHICQAAQSLAQLLFDIESSDQDAKLSQMPFGQMLDHWLDYALEAPQADRSTADRQLPSEPRFARAILDVVWSDYVVAHRALFEWLEQLADHPDLRVRIKAAHALGQLAVDDFDFIAQQTFFRWAVQYKGSRHHVTAWALEEVVRSSPEHLERVFELAEAWAKRDLPEQSTAARLFGTDLSKTDPDRAMRGLRRIVRKSPGLKRWIMWSTLDIFAGGAELAVVQELIRWAGSPDLKTRRIAAESVAQLSQVQGTGQPALLAFFAEAPGEVTELWHRVLTARPSNRKVWDALRTWTKKDIDFTGLRKRLARDPNLRQRMNFYLGPIQQISITHVEEVAQ